MEEESEAYLNFLNTNANLGNKSALLLSYANEFAFYINVEKGNCDKALEYLYSVSLNNKTNKSIYLLNKLKQYLENDLINLAPLTELEKEKEKSNIVSIDLIEPEELDDFIANLDPKAIHAYFQQRKQALLTKSVDTTIKEQPSIWNTGKDIYISNQQDIYPIESKPNFYAMINPKLAGKLDHQLLKKFEAAISKGLIDKEHKSNGIKIIPNKLIELKIASDDDRLYTAWVYKNP